MPEKGVLLATGAAVTGHGRQTQPVPDGSEYGPGLRLIRKRRRYFFATVLIYVPAIWLIHSISPTTRTMSAALGIWVVILLFTTFWSALTRCPRCGNYFHVHGMTLLYLRRCLHCQLHVNADRQGSAP
jgi:hypothetical protein